MGALCLFLGATLQAQNVNDALRYTTFEPAWDSWGQSLGGSASINTESYGASLQNPASAALLNSGSLSFDLNVNYLNAESQFLNRSMSESDQVTSVSNLNVGIKLPTERGSFIFGGGYAKVADFHNYVSGSGYSENSTISDFLASATDPNIRLIGYNGYATDSASTPTGLQSILRYNPFMGIQQNVEQIETGQLGEYYLSFATEFQKDFFVGVSFSFPIGNYAYERTFLERDQDNLYTQTPFDVSNLLVSDGIEAQLSGFYYRVGLIYNPADWLQLGASYRSAYTLSVDESYSKRVVTTYDDGFAPSGDFQNNIAGEFDYNIAGPAEYALSIRSQIPNFEALTLYGTLEYINYESVEFEYDEEFKIQEYDVNQRLGNQVSSTLNYKLGLNYDFGTTDISLGYAHLPSNREGVVMDRNFYSGGLNFEVSKALSISLSSQYVHTEDNQLLYEVGEGSAYQNERTISFDTDRLNVLAGIRYNFVW